MFFFAALPNQGVEIERIEALVNEELEQLKREGVGARELQKAKNQQRSDQVMDRQTVSAKAGELHHYRLYHGDPLAINADLERYMAVTVDEIRRVANEYLVAVNRSVVLVLPASGSGATATASETQRR